MSELLIVDDDHALRRWAERVVTGRGYTADAAADGNQARELLTGNEYQLSLLDINMPGESGMGLLSHIRSNYPQVAVLMVTGEDDTKLAMTAIEQGAYGYLVKPVGAGELVINVATALHRRRMEIDNRRRLALMQQTATERDEKLEEVLQDLYLSEAQVWASQAETIFRLARMVEFRDEETGHHLQRMSLYCAILARRLGFPDERREHLRLASQLHDVGKVAIPDNILLKHGKLTKAEFEIIKTHAQTGFEMLSGSPSEVVQLGALIARTHHERWDGKGYPQGLAGEQIPLEGRIAAIADVFDALTSDRVYRSAFPLASATEMMLEERGHHFDPKLLDLFFQSMDEITEIRNSYAD